MRWNELIFGVYRRDLIDLQIPSMLNILAMLNILGYFKFKFVEFEV